MNGKRLQIGAVLFALIMAVSMVAAPGAALFDGGESEVQFDDSTATIDDELQDAQGTVSVVVRLNDLDGGLIQAQGADALQNHAQASQDDIKSYARDKDGVTLVNSFWITNAVVLEVNTDKVDIDQLASVQGVEELHKNFEVQVPDKPSSESADGPSSVTQAGYETTYGLAQINAPKVWDQFDTKGEGASVAVLDTGVDASHPDIDLAENGFAEFDQNGDIVGTDPRDSDEHGTHVSGTVSGGDASGEYIGVAPDVELYHGLVLDGGQGSFGAILGGMQWAVEQDVDVISMSLGTSGYTQQFIEPVRNARQAGTIVIAAAGNDGEGNIGSPGAVYDALAIGATDRNEDITDFSGGAVVDTQSAWGADAPSEWPSQYVQPDVAAPGNNVKSSVPGGDYSEFPGTSMATPHVSGVVALMEAATDRDLTPDEIREALIETAVKPDDAPDEKDNRYGEGIVDALAAVEYVTDDNETPPPSDGVTLSLSDAEGKSGQTVTVDVKASGDEFGGYEALIEFDPSVVQFQGASSGDLSDVTVNSDNDRGLVKIAQAEQSAVSDVIIAELEFEIVADSGSSDIQFVDSETLVSDTSGNSLSIEYEFGVIEVTEETSCSLPGDVVPDGQLTAADAAVHQQALAGNEVPDDFNADCADVNGDGEVNTGDVVALLNKIVEFDDE